MEGRCGMREESRSASSSDQTNLLLLSDILAAFSTCSERDADPLLMFVVLQAGMQNNILASLTRLSDNELVAQLRSLVARERDATAQIVAHLAELDTRDVHLREGYTSLFVYCRDALGLSEWEAYNRIEVARAARRFPVILDMLAEGSVNLTAGRLLAPHLTPSNQCAVLESARGMKKPQVEELVARLSPRPDVPSTVRCLASWPPGARYPSAQVKRVVWLRDLGRCAFVGTNGHRCNERRFIEFHHLDPYPLGGEATVDQVQLRCRRHNDYEGQLYFGKRRAAGDRGVVRDEPAPYRSCPSGRGELVLEQVDLSVMHSTS